MKLIHKMLPDCTDTTEADYGIHDSLAVNNSQCYRISPENYLEEISHIACDVFQGIGGSATSKQRCKCRTFALLAAFLPCYPFKGSSACFSRF